MCTALTYQTENHYFGRNFDLAPSYKEAVAIVPRNFPLSFRKARTLKRHYAIIGVARVENNYPIYYDGINDKGLGMAALEFPENAYYGSEVPGKDNISPFEFISWILGQCQTIKEVYELLAQMNPIDLAFSRDLPLVALHWLISDKDKSITVEFMREEIKIYDNTVGVLANNPVFDVQLFNLNNYMHISSNPPVNDFSSKVDLKSYCNGMGGMGLPGDFSSMSRFVRAVFIKMNSVCGGTEEESIGQFFHILDSVSTPRGCIHLENGKCAHTIYSVCGNADRGIYYYNTYGNRQISSVDMHKENLEGIDLFTYPLIQDQQIRMLN